MNIPPLAKKALAEFLGVALFLTAIVGQSYAQNPFGGMALAAVLGLAILVTAPISGGHLNPAVSIYFYTRREISLIEMLTYLGSQILGGFFGVLIANQMFLTEIHFATTPDSSNTGSLLSEVFMTGGLVWLVGRLATTGKGNLIPASVALWVFAGVAFSSSGAQANPAVSLALVLHGQATAQSAGYILAQLLGMLIAAVFVVIFADKPKAEVAVAAPAAAVEAVAKKPAARKPAAKKPAAKKPAAK